MFSSDIEKNKLRCVKTALVYLSVSIFCALFGAIYEVFSHGVYSFYMIYAFAYPLVGGALAFLILFFVKTTRYPNNLACNLYHSGVATLTVGSIVQGVLEIYGTTNVLTDFYKIIGIPMVVAGIGIYLFSCVIDPEKI